MPGPLVVDASFAFRLILPNPKQDALQFLVKGWLQEGFQLVAPTLWLYEMTSALCRLVPFDELTPEEGERALALVQGLGVELIPPDEEQARSAFAWTVRLDRAAAYDSLATYHFGP